VSSDAHAGFVASGAHRFEEKIPSRIGWRDSLKKPVLASGDETRSRQTRKFIYCQKPRLRVRATAFQPDSVSRDDVDCASIVQCVNCENTCGAMVSFDIDNRRYRHFQRYSHRRANAPLCCRSTRAACSHIAASTLP
jgi:hypothetical protein